MALLVVAALLFLLAVLGARFGADSRDGRDWQPRQFGSPSGHDRPASVSTSCSVTNPKSGGPTTAAS